MNGWLLFYNTLIVPALYGGFHLLSLVHRKIRHGIRGRKGLFERLRQQAEQMGTGPRLWIHVSSLGEYEQAKPIASFAKERWPELKVVVSFFSPSGYEHANTTGVDAITYLPFDSPPNARRYVELLRPSVALVVRHDIWPNHVRALRQENIPVLLVDASLPPRRGLAGTLARGLYRRLFSLFSAICAISREEAEAISRLVPGTRVEACGDTRYDQVVRRARELAPIRDLVDHPSFKNIDLIVLGSTWPSDEDVLFPALVPCLKRPHTRAIVCPHEPSEDRVLDIVEYFRQAGFRPVTLSTWRQRPTDDWDVIVVDSVGLLANLYALGQVAYVGGSFGPGVHSVLEPAAHGRAIVVGPRYHNSPDARLLVEKGTARVVENVEDARRTFEELLDDPSSREKMAVEALELVRSHTGAAENILDLIAEYVKELQ